MIRKPFIIALLVLALVTMACGINIQLPVTEVKTGPVQEEAINVPLPDSKLTTDLYLSFGAGEITVNPGADNALVSGKAIYNVADFKPVVTSNAGEVKIEQGDLNLKGIPSFKDSVRNEWNLSIGSAPLRLHIKAGAYSGTYHLGGLAIHSLDISDGASDVKLDFAESNQVEMDTFTYSTGASTVSLKGLGNANLANMTFRGGGGSYTLDFSGEIKRDAYVTVESGISSLVIIVPEGVQAKVNFEGGLSNVNPHGAWQKSGSVYTQSGSGPIITIVVKMGAGNLDLRNK